MTVSSENYKDPYAGNGSTTVFPYTFRILAQSHILVQLKVNSTGVVTDQTLTTHYTVSGVGAVGGNVTMLTAPPTGTTLILKRNVSKTQEADYTEYDTFPAETHETALDKLTMIAQQQQEEIDRSIKWDSAVSGLSATIVGTPSANYTIRVNSGATALEFATAATTDTYQFPAGTGILAQTATGNASARTITGTANQITVTNGDGVSGNPTLSLPDDMTLTGKTLTGGTYKIPNIGLKILDTNASHYLSIVPGSDLTADRTLTVTTGDSSRTLTMSGDATISGTNTGDVSAATQAEQEAGVSTTTYVSPGRQQYHPSALKAWIRVTNAGTPANSIGYNISSIGDNGTGSTRINLTTGNSSGALPVVATIEAGVTSGTSISTAVNSSSQVDILTYNAATLTDYNFTASFMGDQ
jgi:hypothetical protein